MPSSTVSPPTFPTASLGARITGAIIASACFALLATAARLNPDPSGMETHRQLGLPPCGWMLTTGMPCPTCGMTTAFAHATHLHPLASLHAQPAGFAACLLTSVIFWAALHCAVFGSRWGWLMDRLLTSRVLIPTAVFVGLAWGYKAFVVWQTNHG